MDKKLQQLLSLKEFIPYLSNSDFIELSYTCKSINKFIDVKARSKLIVFDDEKMTARYENYLIFEKKWKNYIKNYYKSITILQNDYRSKSFNTLKDLHLLTMLQNISLSNIRELDVNYFNTLLNCSTSLRTLYLSKLDIYVRGLELQKFDYLRLPSGLIELTMNDVNILGIYTEDNYSDTSSDDNDFDICKNFIFAPGTDLSNLKFLTYSETQSEFFLLNYLLFLTINLEVLRVDGSLLNEESFNYLSNCAKLKSMELDSLQYIDSIDKYSDYIPKSISSLCLIYHYHVTSWPRSPIISYGFINLKNLTIQYDPTPNSIKNIIAGLASLRYITISGKIYNRDIYNLNFHNSNIKMLRLINFQYSPMNFEIFKKWTELKRIIIDLKTPMTNYYIYFQLCEMLTNWKYYTYPNSVQFWNMDKI